MKTRHLVATVSLTLISAVLCAGAVALYVDLYVGFETRPMMPLSQDADVSSITSGWEYAQGFVDGWESGLNPTAVYAQYREDDDDRLVTTGEITYLFAGTRQDWLAGLARRLGVHVVAATVTIDTNIKTITYFRTTKMDRHLWREMQRDDWNISEHELLLVADEYGGREFRRGYPGAGIKVEVGGQYFGDEWLETHYSDEGKLWILIKLHSGEILKAEGESCDLFPSSWRSVGHLSR